jgi:hypothetical protein
MSAQSARPLMIRWKPGGFYANIGIPDPELDQTDMMRIHKSAGNIDISKRGRAEKIIYTPQFRDWRRTPASTKLLVHGDFHSFNGRTSPLTTLCSSMTQAFRRLPFISLVFFCGCHVLGDEHQGGIAMIRSLLAQLLRQYHFVTDEPLILLSSEHTDDVVRLCHIFKYVMGLLPPGTFVFCFIDSINVYEREEHLQDMWKVVNSLLDLVHVGSAAHFKLLLTSPTRTREVREAFDAENGTLLHLQNLEHIEEHVLWTTVLEKKLFIGFEDMLGLTRDWTHQEIVAVCHSGQGIE